MGLTDQEKLDRLVTAAKEVIELNDKGQRSSITTYYAIERLRWATDSISKGIHHGRA